MLSSSLSGRPVSNHCRLSVPQKSPSPKILSCDARPLVKVLPDVFFGADISYQARFPRGLNPYTEIAEDPAVFEIAPMIVYSPMGPSAYDRPQLRLVYRAAHLNDGARDEYVPEDPRHAHAWVHYVGVEAEWWFNSSTYR